MWQLWLGGAVILGFLLLVAKENNPRQKKRAALMVAIRNGDLIAVERLADSGMNLNFNYNWQFMQLGSPLASAFHRKDRLIADFLIAQGASVSPKSPGNKALLSRAVNGGNFELIDLALKAGYDIHCKLPNRSKPLATAIHHKNIPLARFLLPRGASKEDLTAGDCRWHTMNGDFILFLRELGVDLPPDVLKSVQTGAWDTPRLRQNGGVGG